jgi:hypothetical protein
MAGIENRRTSSTKSTYMRRLNGCVRRTSPWKEEGDILKKAAAYFAVNQP